MSNTVRVLKGRSLRPGMWVEGKQVRRVEESSAYWAVYVEGDIYPRIYDLDYTFTALVSLTS